MNIRYEFIFSDEVFRFRYTPHQMKCPHTSDINSYFQMKCTDSDIPPNSDEVNTNIRYEFISSDDVFRFRYTHFYNKKKYDDVDMW